MFAGRYFAPRFFAPRYFPELGAAVAVDGIYFAPRYFAAEAFAPRYFPGIPGATSPPPPPAAEVFGSGGQPWWLGRKPYRVKRREQDLRDALLQRNPGIVALDLYEAEARALAMARHNLAGQAPHVALGFRWHDVTAGLGQRYDVIVTNPPFHAPGRAERPDIGRRFIAAAAEALAPGGRLWLVANRHLPYEAVLGEAFGQVRTVAERDGYKVVEARKAR